MVDTGDGGAPVQVVCGAPNARAGLVSVFSPPGTYIPGKNITLGVGTIRGVESRGMLCSAAELQISDDHDGIIELPADAPVGVALCRMGRARRSRDRDQPDAEPAGLHRRARHRARSVRRRHGQVQGPGHQADQGRIPLPGEGHRRRRRAVPGLRAAAGARRQERPVAGMAAEAPDLDRPASDQRAGRHHQLHDLRPRAARCTCSTRRR